MKIKNYILLINLIFLIFTYSCKKKQKNNKISHVKQTIDLKKVRKSSEKKDTSKIEKILFSTLPIGNEQLLLNNINEELKKTIFQYYDTIDGIASPFFKPINIKKYEAFYKPTKADTLNKLDSFILKSKKKYSFYTLVKMLPSKNEYTPMIFEGESTKQDYDGNDFLVNRKDLIIVDNKNNIVDEMNLYYDYNDGINVKTKLFFIDKNYKIHIRYYSENEEGLSRFSSIEIFQILDNGMIENENK